MSISTFSPSFSAGRWPEPRPIREITSLLDLDNHLIDPNNYEKVSLCLPRLTETDVDFFLADLERLKTPIHKLDLSHSALKDAAGRRLLGLLLKKEGPVELNLSHTGLTSDCVDALSHWMDRCDACIERLDVSYNHLSEKALHQLGVKAFEKKIVLLGSGNSSPEVRAYERTRRLSSHLFV